MLLAVAAVSGAQSLAPVPPPARIILDRHLGLVRGEFAFRVGIRSLAGSERAGYGDFALDYGVGRGLEIALRGAAGTSRDYTLGNGGLLRNGGSDVELVARYARPVTFGGRVLRIGGQVGVAFPSTPAQSEPLLTLGVLAETDLASGVSLFLNPKVIALRDNSVAGFGVGVSTRLYGGLRLVGEVTPIFAGRNTRSIFDGRQRRITPFSLGLRYRLASGLAIDAAYTNALGPTTGFSLTPGLGGDAQGFVIGLSGRFSLGGRR